MKNPLRKRLPRELKGELGKYLVVFILMVLTIGMVSGFLVADGSMIVAYNDGFEKYNIENGNFRTNQQIYKSQKEEIQNLGIKLYENFYIEEPLDNGSTMRFFKNRTEINGVCLMQGEFPKATGEIAIDRMYADNNELKVGDTLKSQRGKQTWKVTGLVALSDYSCLFQNNNDSMFDSVKFGVSVVTPEEFDTLDQDKLQYNYSWIYDKQPKTEKEEKEVSEELMENIGEIVTLEAFVPRYLNQAITFTGDDMGSDKAMMIILLYIVIVIMAFVFGITISNTIRRESGVIGTLRASGYTRRELIRHYMALPVLVTLVGAWWEIFWDIQYLKMYVQECIMAAIACYLCDRMERRSFSAYNSSSGDHYAGGELWSSPTQIASFPAEIPAQGSFRQKEEKSNLFKPCYKKLFQISPSCDLSEYEQLSGTVYRDYLCQPAVDVWITPSFGLISLSGGNPE